MSCCDWLASAVPDSIAKDLGKGKKQKTTQRNHYLNQQAADDLSPANGTTQPQRLQARQHRLVGLPTH